MLIYNFDLEKKNHEILATLQYKPLYNISHSEKWGKKIQATSYNGVCTVLWGYIQITKKKLNRI